MPKRSINLAIIVLSLLVMAGCSKNIVVNTDGMPISNHEYNLKSSETGVRVVFVLARYYRDYEGKEYIIKPDYLDALLQPTIDPDQTERLIVHIKMINLKKQHYEIGWNVKGPAKLEAEGLMYSGKLSRKDYYLKLPHNKPGSYEYSIRIIDDKGEDLFELPNMQYKVKGGGTAKGS